jgi:pimeloyl-ACP methyl ester carboxylesterase
MYALLDAAGADRVVVGGHSFGGYMSLVFALLHRERTDALILVATGPGYRSDDQRAGWNEMVETMAGRLDDHGLDGLWKADEVDRETHVSAEGLARALRGMVVQHDARVFESLPNIPAPTLIVVGERDERFRGAADYMERKIPGARKVVLNGAGHAANIHQAEAFNSAVLAFLECLT